MRETADLIYLGPNPNLSFISDGKRIIITSHSPIMIYKPIGYFGSCSGIYKCLNKNNHDFIYFIATIFKKNVYIYCTYYMPNRVHTHSSKA